MINYHVTSVIHLALEPYHNAGLTPEDTKRVIESFRGCWCEPGGINHNWNVRVSSTNPDNIERLVELITYCLDEEMVSKGLKLPWRPPVIAYGSL